MHDWLLLHLLRNQALKSKLCAALLAGELQIRVD